MTLALQSPAAVRAALVARGMAAAQAEAAAGGIRPVAFVVEPVEPAEREALVTAALRAGLEALSGEGWALVAGPAARVAGLARPDRVGAPGLERLSAELGRFLSARVEPAAEWHIAGGVVVCTGPRLIGVINVTPDSFSDGGRFLGVTEAVAQAERLKADGADLLDVGGESTRPGAGAVDAAEERHRVVPVVERLVAAGLGPVSVDTRKAEVARAAIDAGAAVINDISGLTHDPAMPAAVRAGGVGVILMHMRGTPETMDREVDYVNVPTDVARELDDRLARAAAAGILPERVALDPGFGFAKTPPQNYELLDGLESVVGLGRPVVVGPSRKRFLGAVTGRPPAERDLATAAACVVGWLRGARLFRVHDVARTREALAVAAASTT